MIHRITNSERSAAACPQRWLLKYGLALRPEGRVRALDVGSFVHEGLEELFCAQHEGSTNPLERALKRIGLARETEIYRIESASSPDHLDPLAYGSQDDVDRVIEAANDAAKLVAGYVAHWNARQFELIRNEGTVETPVMTPRGNASTRTRYTGKVDKVVRYQGRLFIVEHKSTTLALSEWHEKHRRSPQAMGYAIALRREGIECEGVIYDLIQSKPPREWYDLALLKDRSRLAKPKGLPWMTADAFFTAVRELHVDAISSSISTDADPLDIIQGIVTSAKKPDDVEWYLGAYRALLARDEDGFWYRREVELFEDAALERTSDEIYHDATRIRRWKEGTKVFRDRIIAATDEQVPDIVENALQLDGAAFPRQSSLCWQWNRLCPYASLCSSHSRHDVVGFRIERSADGHSELAIEEDALEESQAG
jgi:hypothetical protein